MEQVSIRPVYPLDDFCSQFGIRRTTAYAEIKAGRLKAFKIRGKTVVAGEDGIAWRDSYRSNQPQQRAA